MRILPLARRAPFLHLSAVESTKCLTDHGAAERHIIFKEIRSTEWTTAKSTVKVMDGLFPGQFRPQTEISTKGSFGIARVSGLLVFPKNIFGPDSHWYTETPCGPNRNISNCNVM